MSKIKPREPIYKIDVGYRAIQDADSIEDIICLAVLMSHGQLPHDATVSDAIRHHVDVLGAMCDNCEHINLCLAVVIND